MGARGPVAQPKDHGNAGYTPGLPAMPKGLSPEAQDAWKWVCKQLPIERTSPGDQMALIGLCRWYAKWVKLMDASDADPLDPKIQKQANAAWCTVDQQLRQFGLTLVARARLPAGKAKGDTKSENPYLRLIAHREAKRRPG